ncbi:phage major capsid protein [Raoultella ornithinolytica]|uniref:Phage major capsid protein n=1 Tax=Raoultella ornithinolytica TaxID=54291 RepID=A0A9Q9N254_RAOOR|nr:phage major capsid protein [Raoultella ornithinolytica]UXE36447.1 phage major capsid protein [Raoultella ornithinolytica]
MELNKNQKRAINLVQIEKSINEIDRTVELSFASEEPVIRKIEDNFYNEILLCSPENVDLNRLNDGAPLLVEHDAMRQVGIVENARVDMDKVCRATVRFSALGTAQTIFGMIQEGIRPKISVGYNIRDYYLDGNNLIITKWEPYEISSVSTPADNSVGVGRSLNSNSELTLEDQNQMEEQNMEVKQEETTEAAEVQVEEVIEEEVTEEVQESVLEETLERKFEQHANSIISAVKESINKDIEDKRIRELQSIALVLDVNVDEAITSGISVEEFKRSLNKDNKPIDKEIEIMKKTLIQSAMEDATKLDGFERGINGYTIDLNQMVRGTSDTTSTVTAAGAVKTETTDDYIRTLLARSVLGTLPVTVYGGLAGRGNLAVPKSTGVAPAAKFYGEDEPVSLSVAGFEKVTLKPRHFAAGIPVTKAMRLSNSNIDRYVTDEILRYCSNGLEQAVFAQIQATVPVIETAASGTLTEADVQGAIAALGTANVNVNDCVAIVHPKTLAKLRQTPVLNNVAAVAMVAGHRYDMWLNDEVRVIESTLVAEGSVLIGDFRSVIFANWVEGQELDFDETTKRSEQTMIVWSHQWLDVAIAREEDFVQIKIKA